MHRFAYHRPSTLAEAAGIAGRSEDARYLAGGMTLIPTMKHRLATPSDVIDLGGVDDLRGIAVENETLRIAAGTPHAEVAASEAVGRAVPALAALAGGIGDLAVRNRGTLGGSIANADPGADWPAALLALDAEVETDRRRIPADSFFTGFFETALEPGEIVTAVRFARPRNAAYAKAPNPASRYAVVGVFVARHADGVRVAVTGAGPCAVRHPGLEEALGGKFAAKSVAGVEVSADGLSDDMHASAAYRAHLVGVLAARAVGAC